MPSAGVQDIGTTFVALQVGAVESNPVGLATVPLKLLATKYAESLPDGDKQYLSSTLTVLWSSAAANNLCVVVSLLSGGSFTPICLILGGIVGYNDWVSSQEQRTFWLLCKEMKKENQRLECKWNDPNKDS